MSLNAKTETEQNKVELENGYKVTELIIHVHLLICTIIDPTTWYWQTYSYVLHTQWIEKGLITSEDFNIIQERIYNSVLPIKLMLVEFLEKSLQHFVA